LFIQEDRCPLVRAGGVCDCAHVFSNGSGDGIHRLTRECCRAGCPRRSTGPDCSGARADCHRISRSQSTAQERPPREERGWSTGRATTKSSARGRKGPIEGSGSSFVALFRSLGHRPDSWSRVLMWYSGIGRRTRTPKTTGPRTQGSPRARTPVARISRMMKRTTGALRQKAFAFGLSLGHRR